MPDPSNQWVPLSGDSQNGEDTVLPSNPASAGTERPTTTDTFPSGPPPVGGLLRERGVPVGGLMRVGTPGVETGDLLISVLPRIPGLVSAPVDKTFSADASLVNQVNYYKNLTIAGGVTVTGVARGTIIVVQETFTCAGTLTVSGLGAWGGSGTGVLYANGGGAQSVLTAVYENMIQSFMGAGGGGSAGAAWPDASHLGASANTLAVLLEAIALTSNLAAEGTSTSGPTGSYGPIGGGGGGAGRNGALAGTNGSSGSPATGGTDAGGSGFGGGGSGGPGVGGAGTVPTGGRGGGVLIVVCGTFTGAGTLSADGTNGAAAAGTNQGGAGGGGGGAVLVCYQTAGASTPTLQANAGTGGAKTGAGTAGFSGGAGCAASLQLLGT